MREYPVRLSKHGKKPTTQKLRQWDSPDIWKKMELVTFSFLLNPKSYAL